MLLGKERLGSAPTHSPVEFRPPPVDPPGALLLADLGDRNLLFSEANQSIYELSDLSASVWRSLDKGLNAAQIVRDLVATGLDREEAERAVEETMVERRKLSAADT